MKRVIRAIKFVAAVLALLLVSYALQDFAEMARASDTYIIASTCRYLSVAVPFFAGVVYGRTKRTN